MTADEIKALQDNCKWQMETFDKISYNNTVKLLALVETLVVDNAELRKKDGSGLIAEAEQLMAENAKLKATLIEKDKSIEVLYARWSKEIVKTETALDRLREVVPKDACDEVSYDAANYYHYLSDAIQVLYPKETNDE